MKFTEALEKLFRDGGKITHPRLRFSLGRGYKYYLVLCGDEVYVTAKYQDPVEDYWEWYMTWHYYLSKGDYETIDWEWSELEKDSINNLPKDVMK